MVDFNAVKLIRVERKRYAVGLNAGCRRSEWAQAASKPIRLTPDGKLSCSLSKQSGAQQIEWSVGDSRFQCCLARSNTVERIQLSVVMLYRRTEKSGVDRVDSKL
jgi:hypothetical protein